MTPAFRDDRLVVYQGDVRDVLPELEPGSVDAIVTSPPYWRARHYLPKDHELEEREIGREPTLEDWISTLVAICSDLRRVLRPTGSLWVNLGDSYAAWGGQRDDRKIIRRNSPTVRSPLSGYPAGTRRKSLLLAPYRFAIAMIEEGWILRDRIVWAKSNAIPESVRDRLAVRDEVFLRFTIERFDAFDVGPIRVPEKQSSIERAARAQGRHAKLTGANRRTEPERGAAASIETTPSSIVDRELGVYRYTGRQKAGGNAMVNPGNVWTLPTASREAASYDHFAMFPAELVVRPILSTVPEGGVVLDPFAGTGTVGDVANRLGRRAILVELNPASVDDILRRTAREKLEPIDWRALDLAEPAGEEAADPAPGLWEAVR